MLITVACSSVIHIKDVFSFRKTLVFYVIYNNIISDFLFNELYMKIFECYVEMKYAKEKNSCHLKYSLDCYP